MCAFSFFKGCTYNEKQYQEEKIKFIERTKIVKEVERVEVPKFIQSVTTIHTESEKLISEAKNETPNPATCDLSPERVRRINAATGHP